MIHSNGSAERSGPGDLEVTDRDEEILADAQTARHFDAASDADAKRLEDAQSSTTAHAEKARAKAIADLAGVVSKYDARDIVEMLGGTVADMRRSATRIAVIIDRVVSQESTRTKLVCDAQRLHEIGMDHLLASWRAADEDPRHSGAMRGLAWRAFDEGSDLLRLAREVGT